VTAAWEAAVALSVVSLASRDARSTVRPLKDIGGLAEVSPTALLARKYLGEEGLE
jgi:hypothetical protein